MQQFHHIFLNRCLLLQVIGATGRPPPGAQRFGSQHHTYCTSVYCSAMQCTALCCTAMCCPAHYTLCTALQRIALYCTLGPMTIQAGDPLLSPRHSLVTAISTGWRNFCDLTELLLGGPYWGTRTSQHVLNPWHIQHIRTPSLSSSSPICTAALTKLATQ